MGEKLFYSMGEVAEMFDVNQSLIRHWEKQFDVLRPKRNKKGNRLFTPQDVEYLKLIYHLVKERGMTLEGARKALRRHRADSAVPRDAELMERLQRIRSLLVEVREQLKEEPAGEVYSDSEADHEPAAAEISEAPESQPISKTPSTPAAPVAPAVPVVAEEAVDTVAAEPEVVAEAPAVGSAPVGEPAVEPVAAAGAAETVAAAESDAGDSTEEPANDAADPEKAARAGNGGESGTGTGTAKRPRRKKDDDNELFAFYEQSLF